MASTDGPESRRSRLARSQDAYDRFSAAVDIPLTVIPIAWLPVLIIPLITPVHGAVAETFAVIDYMVWALFVLEYLIKLYLSPSRWHFFKRTSWTCSSSPSPSSAPCERDGWPDWPA